MISMTTADTLGSRTTTGRDAIFRGWYICDGQRLHTNPRRTFAEAHAELIDYAKRMPWVQAEGVEEIMP